MISAVACFVSAVALLLFIIERQRAEDWRATAEAISLANRVLEETLELERHTAKTWKGIAVSLKRSGPDTRN